MQALSQLSYSPRKRCSSSVDEGDSQSMKFFAPLSRSSTLDDAFRKRLIVEEFWSRSPWVRCPRCLSWEGPLSSVSLIGVLFCLLVGSWFGVLGQKKGRTFRSAPLWLRSCLSGSKMISPPRGWIRALPVPTTREIGRASC